MRVEDGTSYCSVKRNGFGTLVYRHMFNSRFVIIHLESYKNMESGENIFNKY